MTNLPSTLAAVLLLAAPAFAADQPAIRAGSELDFRPYCFTDKDGRPTGFGPELLQAVADKMGLKLRLTPGPWDRIWNDLAAGNLDVLPVVARTPGREPLVAFSLPHTETFDAFFVLAGCPFIKDIAAAAGKEIVVLRDDAAHHQLVERRFPGKVVAVDSIPAGLRLVAAGKHDAFLCSKLIGTFEIKEHGIRGVSAGPLIPDYKRVFSFAVRKGNPDLLEILNQGLLIVKADGTYDRIYRRWLTVQEPWHKWLPYFKLAVAGLVGFALLAGVLQVLVRRRTRELKQLTATLEQRVAERSAELTASETRLAANLDAMTRLQKLGTLSVREGSLEPVLGEIVDVAIAIAGADFGNIQLLDPRSGDLRIVSQRGFPDWWLEFWSHAAKGKGACGTALERGERVIVEDVEQSPIFVGTPALDIQRRAGVRAVQSTPLVSRAGQPLGMFSTHYKTPQRPDEVALALLDLLARQAADIIARRQAEAALAAAHRQTQSLINNTPALVYALDLDERFLLVNTALANLFHTTPEQMVGKRRHELMPQADADQHEANDRQVIAAGKAVEFEESSQLGDRSIAWLTTKFPLRDEQGRIYAVAGITADVTARKAAEEALRESERRLALAASGTRIGIFDRNMVTGEILATEQNVRLLGLRTTTTTTTTTTTLSQRYHYREWAERVHTEDRSRVEAEMDRCMQEHVPLESEYRVIWTDGSEHWLAVRGVFVEVIGHSSLGKEPNGPGPVSNSEGRMPNDAAKPPLRLLGILMDITERKRAEESLRESRRAALNLMNDAIAAGARAEWLARFPQENPSPVLRVATDGTVLYRNPAAMERSGWACEPGQPAPAELRALVGQAVARQQGFEEDVQLGGRVYSVAVALFPAERYANLYGRDVTEQRSAQQAVERAKQEWERTFDSVSDLIAIVDDQHRIVRANRAMARRMGLSEQECIGQPCYRHVHRTDCPPASCPHALTRADGQEHKAEFHEEYLDGDFLITATPLRAADGRVTGSVHIMHDITERKRAEAREREMLALTTASQTALDILEAMGEGVLLLDMKGCVVSVNPALERLTGIPARQAIGRPLRELLPLVLSPDDQAFAVRVLAEALKGRIPELTPLTVLNQTGRHVPVIPSVTFVRDANKDATEIVVTLRDISELRVAQESLEESNALLERIFDNTHLCIAYLDKDFHFVRVNRAYADACQHTPEFFAGKKHFDLYPHAENEAIFRRVVETGESFVIAEKPFAFPDHPEWGVTYWDWTLRPLGRAPDHREGLLFCLIDVTQRVLARQKLVESERKYRELVENANSIIIRITPEHDITFFNEYAQTFFGYTAEEVLGKNVVGTIVPPVDSDGRDLRQMVRDVTAQPEVHASNENENMCKDGRRVWVHWANRAVRDAKGNVVEILCVGTDITRRREMEADALRYQQRLRELARRLSGAEEEDRWRISRYIHDTIIQNLSLSSIRLESMEGSLTAANLGEEAKRLRQVLALLDQASEECRTVMSDLTPALLYELGLVPALNGLARQLEEKHETRMIVEDDGQEKPMSHPLRGLLFESVRELVMNALKYAGPCEIRVALRSQDERLTVSVVDNGRGFDPAVEAKRDHPGGFGLFSIRQRLEGLGGRLDIESAPGKGTKATITVPMEGGNSH